MTIPYYESFNGKPPIVERVRECRPRKAMDHLEGDYWELQCGLRRNGGYACQWHTMSDPITIHHEQVDIAAALTRDAINLWYKQWRNTDANKPGCNNAAWDACDDLDDAINHDQVNAFAHSFADALESHP